MGNVPEPSTRHYLTRDIYTHITYADQRSEEEKKQQWSEESEFQLKPDEEILIYNKYLVVLDSVIADTRKDENGEFTFIVLGGSLSVKGLADTIVKVTPLYVVQNSQATTIDAELDEAGLKFQFSGIDTKTNSPVFKVWRKRLDEKPFVLIQAIVFPMINLLWAGCFLMAIGTGIAVWQRVRRKKSAAPLSAEAEE
jgi:cytochrome c-type biogenesis protein CcmF